MHVKHKACPAKTNIFLQCLFKPGLNYALVSILFNFFNIQFRPIHINNNTQHYNDALKVDI